MTMSKLTQATELDKPIFVIKLGGSMIEELSDSFIASLNELRTYHDLVFVHGGGPHMNNMLEKLNIQSEFVNGQRKTTKDVLEVAEMVLGGKMNLFLSSLLKKHGIQAVGISGSDFLKASYMNEKVLGYVGKVEKVNVRLLHSLLLAGYVPVISPLGKTPDGQTLNINADLCAASVAEALKAKKLLFVTDVPGILKEGKVIEQVTVSMIDTFIKNGTIFGGMIPKVTAASSALSDSLKEVMIVSGKDSIFHDGNICGTKIIRNQKVVM